MYSGCVRVRSGSGLCSAKSTGQLDICKSESDYTGDESKDGKPSITAENLKKFLDYFMLANL